MRLVDADKLRYKHSLNTVNTTMPQSFPCITKDEINTAPTVEAIPKNQYEARLTELRSMALRVKHNTGSIDTLIDKLDDLLSEV